MIDARSVSRMRRRLRYSSIAFYFYRYRYLLGFTVFGVMSILIELFLLRLMSGESSPPMGQKLAAFSAGLVFSFAANAMFNFRVPYKYFLSTFVRFAAVSFASFGLNILVVSFLQGQLGVTYFASRLISSGVLFLLAYAMHRRLTFHLDRDFGIAVYASPTEHVRRIFLKVGRNVDHIHIDLIDDTMHPRAKVDLRKVEVARRLWPDIPFALHLMTTNPIRWLDDTLPHVDWVLFSLASHCELEPLFAKCHYQGKRVGVVWHIDDSFSELYRYLSHLDFVMVLGIAKPGFSGQVLSEAAVETVKVLEKIKHKYHFELMFDGSVNQRTIKEIPAKYVVAASSVLKAHQPAKMIYTLKTGARHDREAA